MNNYKEILKWKGDDIRMAVDERNRFRVTLSDEVMDYLDDIKEDNGFKFNGEAITFLVNEHRKLKKNEWSLNYIAQAVTENLYHNLKEELTRIRLGTNNTDRNTQILIELINGIMIHDSVDDIITSDTLESKGLETAKRTVQERIEVKRQKRIEWEEQKK